MKVLVIGCGSIGRRHIQNLTALGAEVLAHDRDPKKAALAVAQSPKTRVSTDLRKLLSLKPAAAVVAVPTAFHAPVALQAARAGCHLFIEKPLSHDLKGLGALRRIVRRKKLVAYLGYNFRFHPSIAALKKGLEKKFIGRVISGRTHFGSYLPERHPGEDYRKGYGARRELGGGVLLDSLSHHFDYLEYLLGRPEAVFCHMGKISSLEIDVEDTVEALLRFPGGAVVSVHGDSVQRPYKHTLELVGDEGTAVSDLFAVTLGHFPVKTRRWKVSRGPKDLNRMYADQMKDFLACVRRRAKAPVGIEAGIDRMKVIDGLRRSMKRGGWVRV